MLNAAGTTTLDTITTCKAGSTTVPTGCQLLGTLDSGDRMLYITVATLGGAGAYRFKVEAVDANGTPGDPTALTPATAAAAVTVGEPGAPMWAATSPVVASIGKSTLSWSIPAQNVGMAASYFLQLWNSGGTAIEGDRVALTPSGSGTGPYTATAMVATAGTYQYQLVAVATYSDGDTSTGTFSAKTSAVRSRECRGCDGAPPARRPGCALTAGGCPRVRCKCFWSDTLLPHLAAAALATAPGTPTVAYTDGKLTLTFTSADVTPGGATPPYTITHWAQAYPAAGGAAVGDPIEVTSGTAQPLNIAPAANLKYKVRAVAAWDNAGTTASRDGPESAATDAIIIGVLPPLPLLLPAAVQVHTTKAAAAACGAACCMGGRSCEPLLLVVLWNAPLTAAPCAMSWSAGIVPDQPAKPALLGGKDKLTVQFVCPTDWANVASWDYDLTRIDPNPDVVLAAVTVAKAAVTKPDSGPCTFDISQAGMPPAHTLGAFSITLVSQRAACQLEARQGHGMRRHKRVDRLLVTLPLPCRRLATHWTALPPSHPTAAPSWVRAVHGCALRGTPCVPLACPNHQPTCTCPAGEPQGPITASASDGNGQLTVAIG